MVNNTTKFILLSAFITQTPTLNSPTVIKTCADNSNIRTISSYPMVDNSNRYMVPSCPTPDNSDMGG